MPPARPKRSTIQDLISTARSLYRSEPEAAFGIAQRAHVKASSINWTLGDAEALLTMSAAQHVLSNYPKASKLAHQALLLFKAARNPVGVGDAHHRLAGLELEMGEYRAAHTHAVAALRIRREKNEHARASDTLTILSTIQWRQAHFAKALEHAIEGLEMAEQSNAPQALAASYSNLGLIYASIGYPDLARSYFSQALERFVNVGDKAGEAGAHLRLGMSFAGSGSRREAERHLRKALAMYEKLQERLGQIRALSALSELFLSRDRTKARTQLEEALALAHEIDHPEALVDVLIRLSRIYQDENKVAKSLLREAIGIAQSIGDLRAETEALELISRCLARDGDHKKAFETLQLHLEKKIRLLRHENSLEIKAIETRRELESIRSEAELHRLRAEDLAARVNEKEKDLSMLALHLVEKQAFIGHLKRHLERPKETRQTVTQLVNRLEKEIQDESGWRTFEEEFEQLSGGFFKILTAKHPTLTTSELKVCALLRIGLSSKRIGGMLHISPSTVDTHRKHIRSKLALSDRKSLMNYLAGL
jgi:tetratricopeptide (TPR) repeat protein/DNA-binding CsgD family transcriptional regulator